jgi:hypothetical protein
MRRRIGAFALVGLALCLGGEAQAQDRDCERIIRVVARHHTNDLAASAADQKALTDDQKRLNQILEKERRAVVADLGCEATQYDEVIACINDTSSRGTALSKDSEREIVTLLCGATPAIRQATDSAFPKK